MLAAFAHIEFGLRAHQGTALCAVPLVIVDALDRLVGFQEALLVMLAHTLGNIDEIFRVQEEVAGEDMPRQQIHHLGLPVGGGRTGRRDVLQIENDDARRPKIQLCRCIQRREPAYQVGDVTLENLAGLLAGLAQLQSVELVFDLI